MSRFLAYLCPRTDKLFKEKDVYVAHLRELARASLTEKRIRREMQPLHDSFAVLRVGATSDSSILDWLVFNRAEIIRLAVLISPGMLKSPSKAYTQANEIVLESRASGVGQINLGKQVDTSLVLPFKSRNSVGSLLAGTVTFVSRKGSHSEFLDAAREVIGRMPGVVAIGGRKSNSLSAYLYAEDWRHVAEQALFLFHNSVWGDIEMDYSLARIIDRQYPSLTFGGYVALCKSGLLEDELLGAPTFAHWLRHGGESALALPMLSPGIEHHEYVCGPNHT
jgi:hypothetical protein